MASCCDECMFYDYDQDGDEYFCDAELDEDEMERFLRGLGGDCPFYRRGGEYETARRQ
ncbi:MAG: hypothetical protein HFG08_07600 [Oscillibacter sp.]|nr:hypothetical protein [Oscillibacter sp.]